MQQRVSVEAHDAAGALVERAPDKDAHLILPKEIDVFVLNRHTDPNNRYGGELYHYRAENIRVRPGVKVKRGYCIRCIEDFRRAREVITHLIDNVEVSGGGRVETKCATFLYLKERYGTDRLVEIAFQPSAEMKRGEIGKVGEIVRKLFGKLKSRRVDHYYVPEHIAGVEGTMQREIALHFVERVARARWQDCPVATSLFPS